MMNDRFSADLRQHLLSTADERPGDGRLGAIVEGVAVTGQRHPLVTRLPWSRARVSPFPSRAMRYGLLVAALIVAVLGAAVFAVGQAGRTPFQGKWTSIDPGDGSTQTLVVGAGTSPSVRFQDEIATGGACVNDPIKLFTADGTGAITGNHMDTSFPDGGGCGLVTVEVNLQFVYDDGTDSLRDQDGVDWVRARGDRPAVPSPTSEPSVATPKPSNTCVQFDAPTTYTAPAGSMSVSVSVPGTVQEPWLGEGDRFNLLRAACTGMAGQGYIESREATRVYTDGCAGTSVAVDTTAEAIAAVAAAKDLRVVRQTDVTLGGYEGTRFYIAVPEGLDSCPDHQIPVVDGLNPFDAGVTYALYLIDVDGKTLALALFNFLEWDPDVTTAVDGILDSIQIDPAPEATPTPTPTPTPMNPGASHGCPVSDQPYTYTDDVGSLAVSVTVPATPGYTWVSEGHDFSLQKVSCATGTGLPLIHAAIVDHIYADACHWKTSRVETPTASDVVAALEAQQGHDTVGPIKTTLGSYSATRFDLSVPRDFDRNSCDVYRDGLSYVTLWGVEIIVTGGTKRVYVADVDGVALVLTAGYYADEATASDLDQIDAIVASLRVAN